VNAVVVRVRTIFVQAKPRNAMNDLQKHLNQLTCFFSKWSKQPPSWSSVSIAEDTNIEHGKVIRIPRWALATPEEYAPRFDQHLDAGHSWINMNAAGILDETLLVVIELPKYVNTVPRDKVSVNFSGPSVKDGELQWDATERIIITD
jgi:hypothetical protein